MRLEFSKAIVLVAVLLGAAACSEAKSSDLIIVNNGTVITATGSDPIPDGVVAIQGDRIIFVGEEDEYKVSTKAQVFDAGGGTTLPGFIDAHTHGTSDPAVRRNFLTNGVTSVCDLGSPLTDLPEFELDRIGEDPVARGLFAGPILTAPGGLPGSVLGEGLSYEVASPEEGRAAVRDLHDRGARQIKVYLQQEVGGVSFPMLDEATLNAIVEEAHARGLPVRAHVTYISLLGMALTAGVDSIEHVPINSTQAETEAGSEDQRDILFQSDDPLQIFLDAAYPEYAVQLQEMAKSGIVFVPTLERPFGDLFRSPSLTHEQGIVLEIILGIVGRFNELGGTIGLGTDFNVGTNIKAGMPMGEFEMLLAAGLTPMDIIEAATRHAAAACGQGDELGTLEPGKLADVVVVDGDPLEDLMLMDQVILVIKDGEVAYEAE
jgi:imidazolonepropionase-like amidohydrolase